ncbi:MAG: arabinofuranan 3-O-arabinosyltransferase, partial [Baekduia sp.]|nr:arabinofuranan 3-O-arabinosyltransferase [Baekduia sp.]
AVGIGEVRGAGVQAVAPARRGAVALACGTTRLQAGGRSVALGGRVDRAALDAGRPLRVTGCDGPVALPAGRSELLGATAPLRLDGVRLTSAAPVAAPATAAGGGRVLDAGVQRPGGRDGVRVQVTGPSWLVLGASYDRFWRARCDGRDLGAPKPMQGYANGWPIAAGCHTVAFTYGLQKAADGAYLISALACAALLGLLLIGALRRRRAPALAGAPPALLAVPPAPRPLPPARALAIAVPVAAVVGAGFGLRAGAVAGPVLAVILWRGIGDAVLGRAAAVLLVLAVPAVYLGVGLAQNDHHLKANATTYPLDRIAGHWLTLAGLLILVVVLWRTLAAARASGPDWPAGVEQPALEEDDPLPSAR